MDKRTNKPVPIKKDVTGEMLNLAVAGLDPDTITKKMAEIATDAEIKNGLENCLAYFRSAANFDPTEERGKAYARLNLLFLSSMKIQDYKAALAAQKEINKLIDLYNPTNANPKTIAIDSIIAEYE